MSNEQAFQAVVVGGSNGIGLAIANRLMAEGHFVHILDRQPPQRELLDNPDRCAFRLCDLLDFHAEELEDLVSNGDVRLLMITAGFGRVADFEYLHPAEIDSLLRVNTMAGLHIVRLFYERLLGQERFYCGMMGSIAGLVSSPMFSVYAASKAAICRFVESVNIELEEKKSPNRILNVSPGSIRGTRFNGGENDPALTRQLAQQIVDHLLATDELFIPDYDSVYRGVIERYRADAHAFGQSSYQYKRDSGRVFNEKRVRIGYLSGTFDLFHVGHLRLIQRARRQCDYLIVGVHPDASHKGKQVFIPFDERMEIVRACRYVDRVVEACREDSDAWLKWHYDRLFVGSDYKGTERFQRYEEFFRDKGVEIIYFPYTQTTNSTQIRRTIEMKTQDDEAKK